MHWSVPDGDYATSTNVERVVIKFPSRPRRLTRPALLQAALPTATVAAVVALISVLTFLG